MLKYFTCFLLTTSFFVASAQKVKVTWGEESKIELTYNSFVNGEGTDMIKLCTESHGGGLFSGKRTITPILSRYNDKLAETNVRRYEVDDNNINLNNLLSIKGKIFMLTSQYDKESKSTSYYSQGINIKSLQPEGKPINLGSFEALNKTSISSVGYVLSKDSSKMMVLALSPYSKKENEKYYMAVYDNLMNKMWDNTVELPYKDKFIKVLSNIVTNDGKVGIILKHYDQEVTKESVKNDGNRTPSYKTKFLLYEQGNKSPTEFILNTGDKFIHTLQLTNDINNNLSLFGLYKNKYDGYVSGFFTTTINKETKQVGAAKMEAFPEALIDQVKIDKQGSNKEKDPGLGNEFKLAQVIDREDGSKDYLLEFNREVYHPSSYVSNGKGGGYWTSAYWTYDDGDILDICFQPNSKIVITRVPKMQNSGTYRIYSNFLALPYKDKLLLFYNDDRDNAEREITKRPEDISKFGKSIFAMAVIDSKGNLNRSTIYDHKEMNLTTAVRECKPLDSKRIGLYAMRGGGLFSAAKDMIGMLQVE